MNTTNALAFLILLIYLEMMFCRASVQSHSGTSIENLEALTTDASAGAFSAQTLLKDLQLLYNPIVTFPCYCFWMFCLSCIQLLKGWMFFI